MGRRDILGNGPARVKAEGTRGERARGTRRTAVEPPRHDLRPPHRTSHDDAAGPPGDSGPGPARCVDRTTNLEGISDMWVTSLVMALLLVSAFGFFAYSTWRLVRIMRLAKQPLTRT